MSFLNRGPSAAPKAPQATKATLPTRAAGKMDATKMGTKSTIPVPGETKEDMERITSWQNDMNSLEATQMQIQADQMNLVHSQVHIMMRELGDLQKHVVALTQKVDDDVGSLRTDLMTAQEEALGALAAQQAQALQDHAATQEQMHAEHQEKHAANAAALENGLSNVLDSAHGKLQDELNLLRHGGAGSLKEMSKILADVTEQVDNLDQALKEEHELRMAVETKLDQMCAELRNDLTVSFSEAHAALRLELAEHGGKADDIKAAMDEAHAALRGELQSSHSQLWSEMEAHGDKHGAMQELVNSMNDEHHEKHAQNSAAMENGLNTVLESAHGKLQDELNLLRHGGAGSLTEMNKILCDVTEQVDNLDQALEKEHELRMAVESKLDQMCDDLKRELELTFKEAHSALKLELAEHGGKADDIKTAMEEANAAMQAELKASHGELKDSLAAHKQNSEDAMSALNAEHHEKHAANSAKLESSISDVLGGAHAKLQDELKILKSGGAGSLKDLSKILADVTTQVDKIDQTVEKEHELRMAVEEKLDKMFNDQDKALQDVRKDLQVALKESHAALKLELAEHGKSKDEIKAAMDDAHAALREEAKLSQESIKNDLATHAKNHATTHRGLQDAMKAMNDEHHEKHAKNSEKLEAKIDNVLGGAHARLQDDLKALKSGGAGSLKDLSKILTDVTQQVDVIDQAVKKEHQLRMAVEEKLDDMFNDQDNKVKDLRKDLQVALKESHAALKLELAEHGQSKEDMRAAMEDAHAALKEEVKLSHSALKDGLDKHMKTNDAKHKNSEEALKAMNDEHHEKHAQNAEKLESSISNVLGGAHAKLAEDLKMLKSGGAGSLKDLSKILADVTTQVDKIDQTVEKEHELRLAVEGKLDRMFNEQDKVIANMQKELQVAMQEGHAALRLELAEHGKSKEEIKAAMMEAHGALKQEMTLHKRSVDDFSKVSKASMSDLETQLRRDLGKVAADTSGLMSMSNSDPGAIHATNAKALESSLHNSLANTHGKLQAELRQLASGVEDIGSLRDILTDVTKQVDNLAIAIDREHDLRMAVEGKLDKMCEDLRKEADVALQESHAAIRVELAAQKGDANEMKAAMAQAHKALKSEHGIAHGDLHGKLESHGRAHKASLDDMEKQLRNDLGRVAGDVDGRHRELKSMHAKTQEALEQRFSMLEAGHNDKHGAMFRELQATNTKLQELHSGIQGHKSKIDLHNSTLEERLGYLERQLKERLDSQNVLAGQFRGESLTREKNMSTLDQKLMILETRLVDVNDRGAKDMEGAHGKLREALMRIEQQKSLNDNQMAMVEQRLSHLDRAILEVSDSHSKSLSAFHSEYGKEMTHLLHAERMAREQQEKTFLDYIQDARQQKEALEVTMAEQLRLERVAREVQAQQMRDAMSHQVLWQQGNNEYTDILLQERSSREATERALERRIEAFERAVSMERNERAQEMQRMWDAFDGHTHEAMSPVVREVQKIVPPTSMAPRAIMSPRSIPTTNQIVEDLIQERIIAPYESYTPSMTPAAMTPAVPMTSMSAPVVSTLPRGTRLR